MEPAAFVTELRQRLAVPDSAADGWCPRCDDVMDRCSRRAAVCSVGGERTLRHHALRNTLFTWIDRAGLQPERERLGLLLPQHPEDTRVAARRPADIFVPSYMGSPTAFDLAVTAPQRQETLVEAARRSLAAATAYAGVKAAHLNRAEVCRAEGVRFPLVGGDRWGPVGARCQCAFCTAY